MRSRHLRALALLLLLLTACAPLQGPGDRAGAMRPTAAPLALERDDLPLAELARAVRAEIAFFARAPAAGGPWVFGRRALSRDEYVRGLARFAELAEAAAAPDPTSPEAVRRARFAEAVRREFDFYEVYGQQDWGDTFISSYYEPRIEGSLKPTARFSRALYKTPPDLALLDLAPFHDKFKDERKFRGRLAKGPQGEPAFVPYYTREEIDSKAALAGRKLELAWVEPWDAFLLQTQGSGTLRLPDGKLLRLIYANRNGRSYDSIGKFIKDKLAPGEELNLDSIEAYLRKQTPGEAQRLLNLNASYVFFQPSETSAVTDLGVPATDGRTVAVDPKLFPKGALAFLTTDGISRFVLGQDVGGAIAGPGRLDLFWGRGDAAKREAGRVKRHGRLVYLAPKANGNPALPPSPR